jgi:hypothetical protein
MVDHALFQTLSPMTNTPYTAVIDDMQREARGLVSLFYPGSSRF